MVGFFYIVLLLIIHGTIISVINYNKNIDLSFIGIISSILTACVIKYILLRMEGIDILSMIMG